MRVIWKGTLAIIDRQQKMLPTDAHILSVGIQAGQITIWFACGADAPKASAEFAIAGTGHECPDPLLYEYLGTVQLERFVWHVFKKRG